jgi:hypothetical protein
VFRHLPRRLSAGGEEAAEQSARRRQSTTMPVTLGLIMKTALFPSFKIGSGDSIRFGVE